MGEHPVINPKALNQFVQVGHFKMEGLHLFPDLTQRGDWIIILDLKDAYLQVPIHEAHHCFLQFVREGKQYKFQCLPFGLSSAQRVFTKLLKPVVVHANREQLEIMAPMIVNLFKALGLSKITFNINSVESFWGFQINSSNLKFSLPPEKSRKIQQEASKLLQCQVLSARELAIFIGKVTATSWTLWGLTEEA